MNPMLLVDSIRKTFPSLRHAEYAPSQLDSGQNAHVLDFGSHIARLSRYAGHEGVLEREAAVLAGIGASLPIPVPRIELQRVEGVLVAVHEKIPGEPLVTLADLDADLHERIATELGTFLSVLHAMPAASVGTASIPLEDTAFWERWLNQVRTRLLPLIEPEHAMHFEGLASAFLKEYPTLPLSLKHGDFGTDNILAQGGQLTGIIDFGSVAFGDAASDLAGLAASYGESFLGLVATSYPGLEAMRPRLTFYRLAFAAMEALHGQDHHDNDALEAGLAGLRAKGRA